jgi:hypothetical protein
MMHILPVNLVRETGTGNRETVEGVISEGRIMRSAPFFVHTQEEGMAK